MKRCLLIFFFCAFRIACLEASEVRQGEPVITFEKLYAPESIRQGELYQISADMSTQKNIWENMCVFLHISQPSDNKILINNDFFPQILTSYWTPGQMVRVGPVNCYMPLDISPGTYNIRMGLFVTKTTPDTATYIAEPYTNKDIQGFVVGQIKVEPALPKAQRNKEDLVISNFETVVDIKKWECSRCRMEQDSDNVAEGKYAAKVTYLRNSGCCPAPILESFFNYSDPKYSNWDDYDILRFNIYGPKEDEHTYLKIPVTLQVKDKSGNRFQWPISVTQEKDQPVSFNLSVIGKAVDLGNIGNLCFFLSGTSADKDEVAFLDDIRLVSLNLDNENFPFVKFEGLKITKDKVSAGGEVEFEPSFSASHKFTEDHRLFIHIYRANDKAGWINADTDPSPPTTEWEENKTITQGPFEVFIPPDAPPGRYNIDMGLFLTKRVPRDGNYAKYHRGKNGVYYIQQPDYPTDYFKQPYVNYEQYGDWVVGSFEVTAPAPE